MRKIWKLTALILAAVLLTGCAGLTSALNGVSMVKYEDMEYTRPDMGEMEAALDAAVEIARDEGSGENPRAVMDAIYDFYDEYDSFYTNYALADIRSCHDLTDIYWEEEYAFCMENTAAADAMLEELYYALAQSPCREALEGEMYFGEGFFDAYEGESMYDEGFLALLEQEAALIGQYYDLSSDALNYEYGSAAFYDDCGEKMAQLLVELIGLRQEIAAYWGYDNYVQFANDFYYYRDYTPQQTEAYLQDIATYLVPIYRYLDLSSIGALSGSYSSEKRTLDFVRSAAKNMGGMVEEAFTIMEGAGLYDISYGKNKYNTSFEIYLTSYYLPFVFMNPERSRYDCLTLSHEFGHFCNDYACFGSYAGVDVMEVFSQGMEYLSLCYGENTEDLTRIKMADSLCLFVEQAAFARFEQRMYNLTGEDLTAENLCRLYEEVAEEYGFETVGYDNREFVTITHFYTNPMYILSYVFSNDAAMQLYQLEKAEAGAGLALYKANLDSQEPWFLAFLETAGLESPFAEGRVKQIANTFRESLN